MDFTIYSLGDAAFLYAVLNAVSSIPENVYMQLGGLGAILGLLIMGVKGANEGNLMKAGFQGLIVSLVIFWIMFIPRVDRVVVKDMAPSPTAPPLYVVDNVPAGFAAVGSTMSTVGVYIARLFDQAFGDVDENRVLTGGIGDNLRRITMLRQMADPVFIEASNVSSLQLFRSNLAQYIGQCTMTGLSTGELPNRTLSVQSDENGDGFVNALDGMHFPHKALQTRLKDGNGQPQVMSCAEASKAVLSLSGFNPASGGENGDAGMARAFDEAMNGRTTFGDTVETMDRFGMDRAAQWMQSAMVNQVVAAATMESLRTGGSSQGGAMSAMMVEEAAARRNVQFAGEQNMFIRGMRTTIGFFEAVFYALGPIMAILVMTGPMGLTIASKYVMLTVWVLLWYPMLAIINLYGNVKMQTLVTELASNPDYVTSPIGTHQLMVIAQDQLGTIAGLVAATPVLAMSLIYGGAVAMNAVASRLSGGDQINEGYVAPQAMDTAPALQAGAMGTSRGGEAMMRTGQSSPSAQQGTMAQESLKTAQAMQEQRSQALMAELARTSQESNGFTVSASTKQVASDGTTFNDNLSNGLQFASQSNLQIANSLSTLEKLGASVQMEMGLSSGKYIPIFSVGASNNAQTAEERAQVDQAVRSLNTAFSEDASAGQNFSKGLAQSIQAETSQTGSNSRTDSLSSSLKESASEVVTASNMAERAQARINSGGFDDTRTFSQIEKGWELAGTKAANFSALDQRLSDVSGGREVFEGSVAMARAQGYTSDQATLMGYAAVANMQGASPADEAAIQELRSEFLDRSGLIGTAVPTGPNADAVAALERNTSSVNMGGSFDPSNAVGGVIQNAPTFGGATVAAGGAQSNAAGVISRVQGEISAGQGGLDTPQGRAESAEKAFEESRTSIDSSFKLESPMGAMAQRFAGEGAVNYLQTPENVTEGQATAALGAARVAELEAKVAEASSPSLLESLGVGGDDARIDREMKLEQLNTDLAKAREDFSSLPAADREFGVRAVEIYGSRAGTYGDVPNVQDTDEANKLLEITGHMATAAAVREEAAEQARAREEFVRSRGAQ